MSLDHELTSEHYFAHELSLRDCLKDMQPDADDNLVDETVEGFMAEAREDFLAFLDKALQGEERNRAGPDHVENGPDRLGNEDVGRDDELDTRVEQAIRERLMGVSNRYMRCMEDVIERERESPPRSRRHRRNHSPRPRRRRQNNSPRADKRRLRIASESD
jgi:hypothetical protein